MKHYNTRSDISATAIQKINRGFKRTGWGIELIKKDYLKLLVEFFLHLHLHLQGLRNLVAPAMG